MDPNALYEIVELYAGFGDHHTGTPADLATAAWVAGALTARGATVETRPFEFDRYEVTAELRARSGEVIPSVPVFYSYVGAIETDHLELVSVPRGAEAPARALDPVLDGVQAPGAVVAVEGVTPHPIQCNRVAAVRADGPPGVIVAGDRLADADGATLRYEASVERAEAPNIVAELGEASAPPVTITTPLSGWTPAAGERGTGLAVALALAANLAVDHRVRFVACSGHELDHLGLHRFLDTTEVAGDRVIHIGASVGAVEWNDDGTAVLGSERLTLTTATGDIRDEIGRRVVDGNWTLTDRESWAGEGGAWRGAGADVLSFLGSSALFHTAGDLPAAATTPAAMATACEVVIDAARVFLTAEG